MKDPIVGQTTKVTATFRDGNRETYDPIALTWEVKTPAGVVSAPVVTRESEGVYSFPIKHSAAGAWKYRVVSTDDSDFAVHVGTIIVHADGF
jgi:hypothetical protein